MSLCVSLNRSKLIDAVFSEDLRVTQYIYRPQQGYVFTGVCDSVNRGGVPHAPPGADTSPGADTPPRADTSPEQTPPQSRHPPGTKYTPSEHAVNARAVRILLECSLV